MSLPPTEPLIRVRGLRKTFGTGEAETPVLKGIDLDIWKGKFTAIIGSSGSGKSTLLNMLALLDRPSAGSILYQDKDLATLSDEERAAMRSKIFGFVFQQYNLMPWLDAHDNVTLPTLFGERPLDTEWVRREFESIGLTNRMDHYPTEMSGGEQQRVAILRALVNDPEIIIADEPTGNLDSATGNKILEMLLGLNKQKGKTLIIVTHDADIARMADQVIIIKDGIIAQNGGGYQQLYTE